METGNRIGVGEECLMRSRKQTSSRKVRLKELVFFQRGFDITKAQQKPGPYPVISSSGIQSYHSEFMVKGPGVVIGRKGTLGTIHFSKGDYWPHDTTLWSRELHGNDPRFVYYFLHTLNLENFNVGGANPTLNRNHIHDLEIDIPPLSVQERIAAILSAYDDLIENNLRRIALLEESARMLYKEWFVRLRFPGYEHTRLLDGVPVGWTKTRMRDVCETVGGGTPSTAKPEYWEDGDIIWVIPSDITKNNCLILLESEKKITEAGLKNSSAKLVPSETILMTSRASVGFFGLIDRQVCTNQGFICIIPNQENTRMYLLHNLMSRREEILSKAGGTTYKEINKSTFRDLEIVVPRQSLLDPFRHFAYDVVRQTRLLKKQAEGLKDARNLLLPRLMSGEIEV